MDDIVRLFNKNTSLADNKFSDMYKEISITQKELERFVEHVNVNFEKQIEEIHSIKFPQTHKPT